MTAKTLLHPFNYDGVRLLPGRMLDQVENARAIYGAIPNDDILHGFRRNAAARLSPPAPVAPEPIGRRRMRGMEASSEPRHIFARSSPPARGGLEGETRKVRWTFRRPETATAMPERKILRSAAKEET